MAKYTKNQQIIDGEIDDNQVMMHIEKGKYYGLNPVGKRIWDMLEQPKSFDQITQILLAEFNVTEEQCKTEINAFLDKAIQYDIIKKSE